MSAFDSDLCIKLIWGIQVRCSTIRAIRWKRIHIHTKIGAKMRVRYNYMVGLGSMHACIHDLDADAHSFVHSSIHSFNHSFIHPTYTHIYTLS